MALMPQRLGPLRPHPRQATPPHRAAHHACPASPSSAIPHPSAHYPRRPDSRSAASSPKSTRLRPSSRRASRLPRDSETLKLPDPAALDQLPPDALGVDSSPTWRYCPGCLTEIRQARISLPAPSLPPQQPRCFTAPLMGCSTPALTRSSAFSSVYSLLPPRTQVACDYGRALLDGKSRREEEDSKGYSPKALQPRRLQPRLRHLPQKGLLLPALERVLCTSQRKLFPCGGKPWRAMSLEASKQNSWGCDMLYTAAIRRDRAHQDQQPGTMRAARSSCPPLGGGIGCDWLIRRVLLRSTQRLTDTQRQNLQVPLKASKKEDSSAVNLSLSPPLPVPAVPAPCPRTSHSAFVPADDRVPPHGRGLGIVRRVVVRGLLKSLLISHLKCGAQGARGSALDRFRIISSDALHARETREGERAASARRFGAWERGFCLKVNQSVSEDHTVLDVLITPAFAWTGINAALFWRTRHRGGESQGEPTRPGKMRTILIAETYGLDGIDANEPNESPRLGVQIEARNLTPGGGGEQPEKPLRGADNEDAAVQVKIKIQPKLVVVENLEVLGS
ncbi:hypothetical protein DFH06DRAFT_1124342 [Mycena polygramma]|nr:hypothetical protein DFH06DRAFT_1124342 [Mycena polygramma]